MTNYLIIIILIVDCIRTHALPLLIHFAIHIAPHLSVIIAINFVIRLSVHDFIHYFALLLHQ
jgi:hypothetical protein